MEIKIKPLIQKTQFGCLATCYAMAINYFFGEKKYDQRIESDLTSQSFAIKTGFNEHFYLQRLSRKGCKILVYLETPYMEEEYKKINTVLGGNIKIEHRLIDVGDFIRLIKKGYLIITSIDLWYIDMIVNFAHFVIVNGYEKDCLSIIDPKYGKQIKFSTKRFQDSLDSLKYRLKHSPVIFAIKK